jgi:hypothetical protein
VLNITASWEQANDDVVNVAWARDSWNDMKSFSTGGNYINFLTEDETPNMSPRSSERASNASAM